MAMTKCTALFDLVTNLSGGGLGSRVGGWSESIYTSLTGDLLRGIFEDWCLRRAAMLPIGAKIVGQRYQLVDPVRRATTAGRIFPGGAGACDVPQMAVTFTQPGVGVPNNRRWILRGTPDARVIEGEYVPSATFTAAFASWWHRNTSFKFRAKNLEVATVPVTSIAADGTFLLQQPLTYAPNDYLNIRGAIDSRRESFSGRFHVSVRTDAQNGKFDNWVAIPTLGGSARQDEVIYPSLDGDSPIPELRVIVRKVGRPFGGYRGRRSSRV